MATRSQDPKSTVRMRHLVGAEGTEAAAQAGWRRAYSDCMDRLDSIRQGIEKHSFYTSELLALDEALKVPEQAAWHPKEP